MGELQELRDHEDGDDDSFEGDLAALLSGLAPDTGHGRAGALDVDGLSPSPPKPKFYCAGARRTNEDTGKKLCNYKAPKKWYTACPKCRNNFACLPIKSGANSTTRVTLGAETMEKVKDLVYYSTGIPELDKVLGGGLCLEMSMLFGAPRGGGKTTIALQACDGFAQNGRKSYFASGEMTRESILNYAKRLGIVNPNIGLFGNPEGVDVEDLFEDVISFGARFLCLDSIQVATVSDVKADIGTGTMCDAVANMLTSFAQKKRRAVLAIGHLQKGGDFGGTEKMQHLVDGLLRMDTKWVQDVMPDGRAGKPRDTMIRELSMDAKSRQGRADMTAFVELTEQGVKSASISRLRDAGLLATG